MNVTSAVYAPVRAQGQSPAPAPKPDPGPGEPKDAVDRFADATLRVGLATLNGVGESSLYYLGGAGSIGGGMAFGALYEGATSGLEAHLGKADAKHTAAATGIGALSGAVKGWALVSLAHACGLGLGGAVVAGAALGLGTGIANELFPDKK